MARRRPLDSLLVSPRVTLSGDRERQVRNFSVLLLVIIVVGFALSVFYVVETRDDPAAAAVDHVVSFTTIAVLAILYFVNRAGRFVTAASTTVAVAAAAIFVSAIPTGSGAETQMLGYLAIPIVLSGIALSVRFTTIIAGASILGVLLFPFVFDVTTGDLPLTATILIGAFVVVAARHRGQVEADRRRTLRENERRLAELVTHDPLTGLPNRLIFAEEAASAIARARRTNRSVAVLFLDVDNFKSINDALGHEAGDDLLRQVALRLRESVRGGDIVSRQGGDEFCILIDSLSGTRATTSVVQKLLARMRSPYPVCDQEVFVTASVGVSLYPDDAVDPGELIRRADTALYRAKDRGKDTFVFYSAQMSSEATFRLQLAADLQHAIERDEISVLYQPQVDSDTGEITGVECLARWTHEQHGVVSPATFVPLAEQSGVITNLTRLVTGTALETQELVHSSTAGSGRRLRVAVNISERDLRSDELADWVSAMVETGVLVANELEIELTENIVFGHLDQAMPMLERLKGLGVRLAVDDFGSGYATLRQIADFPIDVVKIDRSFTSGIEVGSGRAAIIAGIVEIASRLGIDLVAEGVETEHELQILRALGCRVFQGWYYSRAVMTDELVSLVRRGFPRAQLRDTLGR